MRLKSLLIALGLFSIGAATGVGVTAQRQSSTAMSTACGPAAQSQLRTTLYFGMSRPTGAVSELEWQLFLRDVVTPKFPDGLTVWDAQGQWKGKRGLEQERSKVLLLVHHDVAEAQTAVQSVISQYRKQFDQESVLWETARVCIAG